MIGLTKLCNIRGIRVSIRLSVEYSTIIIMR